jgi:hypothetical protein
MRNLWNKQLKQEFKFHKPALRIVLGIFGGLFAYFFSKSMVIKPEGLYIGQANAWGDWAVHISLTNIFATKPIAEWFLYHPFYAYGKLTYGFLVHLITALFMRLGFSLPSAFFIVSIVLLFFFLSGLYFFYYQLSQSRKESVLAIFLFFTSSGMGIVKYLNTLNFEKIFHPMQDYTRLLEYDWLAGNIPAAMLIPQRAFFIGVTMSIWVLNLLLLGLGKNSPVTHQQKKLLLGAGILAGLLPIAHMHSFIAIVILTGIICFFYRNKLERLIYFITPATIISIILYLKFIHNGIEIDNFMTIIIGWTSEGSLLSWLIMWLKLWGTFLPSVIVAVFLFKKSKLFQKYFPLYLGFGLIFLIANIVVFQPTLWDNTKLFAWVYLGFSILVAKLLFYFWHQSLRLKLFTIILIFTLSATGFVELLRIFNLEQNTHLLSSAQEINFAQQIAKNSQTDDIFLTSTSHNHPIPLWANRPIFLGYLGWVQNFGFESASRDQKLRQVYQGINNANQILIDNKISYIYVGPSEIQMYKINFDYLQQFPVAFQNENTVVYVTKQLWQ